MVFNLVVNHALIFIMLYIKKNIEKLKVYFAQYRSNEKNKDKAKKYAVNYHKIYGKINKKHKAEYDVAYKKNNREKIKINKHKRRALEKNASGKLSNGITNKLLTLQNNLCIVCRNKLIKYHIDHIVPLSKGGSNDDYNVQLLCPSCNHQKNAKHPIDFMQQKGYLL